jgi:Uma2 family endonuclease
MAHESRSCGIPTKSPFEMSRGIIGFMKTAQPTLTYPELRLMPDDGKRYELVEGEVFVSPSPSERHQRTLARLFLSLGGYVERKKLGRVYFAPFDVVFSEKTALQPDLLFVSSARLGIIGPEYIIGAPDLVVEILSPHRTSYDRVTKLEQYALYRVGEYWIIDLMAETIEVYMLTGKRYELRATLGLDQSVTTPLLPGWQLAVRDLFAQ